MYSSGNVSTILREQVVNKRLVEEHNEKGTVMELVNIIEGAGIQFMHEEAHGWRWGIPGVFGWSESYASKEEALGYALRMIVYKACLYQALEVSTQEFGQHQLVST